MLWAPLLLILRLCPCVPNLTAGSQSAKEVEEEKARRRRERFNMTTEEDKKVKQAKLLEELKGVWRPAGGCLRACHGTAESWTWRHREATCIGLHQQLPVRWGWRWGWGPDRLHVAHST